MCNQDTVWNSGFKVGNNASFVSLNLTARIFDLLVISASVTSQQLGLLVRVEALFTE